MSKKKKIKDTERIEMLWDYIDELDFEKQVTMERWDDGYDIQLKIKDELKDNEKIQILWDYIEYLNFNGEMKMNWVDGGYEIIFTWKDWSKK